MRRKVGAAAFAAAAIAIGGAGTASAEEKVVEVTLGSQAEVERLIATGADIDHSVDRRDGKVVVEVVTDELGVQELRSKGFAVGREVFSESTSEARLAERDRQLAADTPSEAEGVKVLRASWYTTQGGSASQGDLRLHVEAKSFFEEDDTLTVRWDRGAGTEMGSGGSATLTPFVELGVYLYHTRTLDLRHGVDERPARIELSSSRTGKTVTSAVEEWLPVDGWTHRLAAMLQAGSVYVNAWGMSDAAAPFGGYKASGIGREMGHANLDAYLEIKTVWTSL